MLVAVVYAYSIPVTLDEQISRVCDRVNGTGMYLDCLVTLRIASSAYSSTLTSPKITEKEKGGAA